MQTPNAGTARQNFNPTSTSPKEWQPIPRYEQLKFSGDPQMALLARLQLTSCSVTSCERNIQLAVRELLVMVQACGGTQHATAHKLLWQAGSIDSCPPHAKHNISASPTASASVNYLSTSLLHSCANHSWQGEYEISHSLLSLPVESLPRNYSRISC